MPSPNEQLVLSWQQLGTSRDGLAAVFYQRLFALAPTLRELFRNTDMPAQEQKLTATLGALVSGAVSADALAELGRRHAGYGVRPEHYGVVAEALLWSLEQRLGALWTKATQAAWEDALTRVAGIMLNGADDAGARRERDGSPATQAG
jgi:hemoglobin-like flavoprotein